MFEIVTDITNCKLKEKQKEQKAIILRVHENKHGEETQTKLHKWS